MAISGWFHIPQEGEEGYEEGLEERLAEKSSLAQLQGGKADVFDEPRAQWVELPGNGADEKDEEEEEPLNENEIDFLLNYMNPQYLTPDTVDELSEMFGDESSLRLAEFLSVKFSAGLRAYLEEKDHEATPSLPPNPIYPQQSKTGVARPPHKHRYLYRQAVDLVATTNYPDEGLTPYDELVDILFPHPAFAKWISLVTGITLTRSNILARRFRRGLDYTLASAFEEEDPQLEVCLGITPSKGWGDEDEEADDEEEENKKEKDGKKGKEATKKTKKVEVNGKEAAIEKPEEEVGGYEMYMAGEDDDDDDTASTAGLPPTTSSSGPSTSTGAGQRRKTKADPAIYKAADDDDDGVLFSQPAAWNNLAIVLRDRGVLRFTKYVSESAKGDRWDVCAEFGVEFGEDSDSEDEEAEGGKKGGK
jgi:hypothetical protein